MTCPPLGRLICTNDQPHEGGESRRGCVHDGGSGMAHHRHEDDGGES